MASAYAEAQARLTDAKRRRDSRSIHAAVEESKRLLTQGLRDRFRPEPELRGRRWPVLDWWRRGA